MNTLALTYLLMMLLQIWHIFEEIGMGAYKIAHSLGKYLVAASILVTINFVAFTLILMGIRVGYYVGLFASGILAIGNGLVHLFGWLKTRKLRDGIGAGIFTGIPLAIIGTHITTPSIIPILRGMYQKVILIC